MSEAKEEVNRLWHACKHKPDYHSNGLELDWLCAEVVASTPANPACKYDLDYSRFENLDEDEDENPQQASQLPESICLENPNLLR